MAHEHAPAEFVIRAARIFDGRRMLEKADVLVRNGRIARIAPALLARAGIRELDGTGATLLPGLIDAHVHNFLQARRDALRFGVTTILDMFSDWRHIADARRDRESFEVTDSADMWSAGTPATAPGGHGTQYRLKIPTLSSSTDASAWVDARLEEGSDYIKIIVEDRRIHGAGRVQTLDSATLRAVVDAAHARARLAVVHASAEEPAFEAVEAGADGLMHVVHDGLVSSNFVLRAHARDCFVVATLCAIAGEGDDVTSDPRLSVWLTDDQRRRLVAEPRRGASRRRMADNARENVRRLHEAGVRILAGTDAPNPGTAHGASMHSEIVRLAAAGLSPTEALAAGTSLPAEIFGLRDRGRIIEGMRADLLLVDGDPTQDLMATRDIRGIWKNGSAVDREPFRASGPFAATP